MNAHEVVLTAAVGVLKQSPAIAAGNVFRGRRRPVDDTIDELVAVRFGGSTPDRGSINGAPVDWTTVIRFDCYARGTPLLSGDERALALHAAAWNRLFANTSLGGQVMDMSPASIDTEDDELDTSLACAIGAVQVLHRTGAYTLEITP
jgi:hypothetical protein